jgi:hypothetical protein
MSFMEQFKKQIMQFICNIHIYLEIYWWSKHALDVKQKTWMSTLLAY